MGREVSSSTYAKDPHYPRVVLAVTALLDRGNGVAPVDVLVGMGLLTSESLEDWRRGRVPHLERVIRCNLSKLSRILRILQFHARDRGLYPSVTVYNRWSKGPKQRLRFTKSGDPSLEEAYATHFVRRAKAPPAEDAPPREPPPPG